MDGAIEKVQETAPLVKNSGLITLQCQLMLDVVLLDELGVVTI